MTTTRPIIPEWEGCPLPAVHLNGTSRETLLREYSEALQAVIEAENKLLDVTCHGRDYYVYAGSAFYRAQAHRRTMLLKFQDLRHYLQAHVDHLTSSQASR